MRIGQLSSITGLSRDALRFYEKTGLLRARRDASGYRNYPEEAVAWLGYVRLAQSLGFSLAEIASELAVLAKADSSELHAVLKAKLAVVDERLRTMQKMRDELHKRVSDPTFSDCPLRRS
jgi:MerR family transcriptional regulator, copper efflux regulator